MTDSGWGVTDAAHRIGGNDWTVIAVLDGLQIEETQRYFGLQSFVPHLHTGRPTGVAVSYCITWYQGQLIPTTCQIRYHSHL